MTGAEPSHGGPNAKPTQWLLWAAGEAHRLRRGRTGGAGQLPTGGDGFELQETTQGGRVHLSVVGELDAASAARFSESVQALVGAGARSIVVDLGRARVVDGPGLWALRGGRMLVEAHRGELVLKSPRSDTLAVLERARLGDAFPIC